MKQQGEKLRSYKRRRQSPLPPLPIDLTSEILLRLPEKSVARFRCVSKLWLSVSTDPYFINLFETRSSPRPSLLLCFNKDEYLYVFSIPQHTYTLRKGSNKTYSSSQPIESYHVKFPGGTYSSMPQAPTDSVHGLICFHAEKPIVWNPSKKQFLTLPKPSKSWDAVRVFLGYDPVKGKHKVMCMPSDRSSDVCRVLTLGSTQESWRTVKINHEHCCSFYNSYTSVQCIEGVIYYVAYIREQAYVWVSVVMSFDVRSEQFGIIKPPSDFYQQKLINYGGKLACFSSKSRKRLRILEDAEKHEWSICESCDNLLFSSHSSFTPTGFTHDAGEFVFVPPDFSKSSYVLFGDPMTNSFRRFEFKGIIEGEPFSAPWLRAFPNHIESQFSL